MTARWTTAQLREHRARLIDRQAARQKRIATTDKVDLFCRLCEISGLPEPVREYRFHDRRKWRIDYYFETNGKRVALEVEGGVWTRGRHTRGVGFLGDMEKYNAISAAGIILLRTTPDKLMTDQTIQLLKSALL